MITTIPFSGFYYTVHDSAVSEVMYRMFADRDTGCHTNKGLVSACSRNCSYHSVHLKYAKEYCESFAAEYNIKLKFDGMASPREYNFTTDRIFARITQQEARRIYNETDKSRLAKFAKETFTSRSGFISSYSPNVKDWGALRTWDHNQLGCLIEAYTDQGNDQYKELELMESAQCNGDIENWIAESTENIERLYKIHDYLEQRSHRQ